MLKLSDESARILLESIHAREQACAVMEAVARRVEECRRIREAAAMTRALSALLRREYRQAVRQAALLRAESATWTKAIGEGHRP